MTDQTRRVTIDAPDGPTILAARHLDATEGPVQVGATVTTATRSAIDRVLGYVARAHNSPAATEATSGASCPRTTSDNSTTSSNGAGHGAWEQQGDGTWTLSVDEGTVLFTNRTTPEQRAAFAEAWKAPALVRRFTARPVTPEMEAAATARARQAAADSEKAAAWYSKHCAPDARYDQLQQRVHELESLASDADRLRTDWTTMRDRAESAEATLREVLDAFEAYWARASYCGPGQSAVQPEHFQGWRNVLKQPKEPRLVTSPQWNGEPCTARQITAIVADNTAFPGYWARPFVGMRRKIVEVTYGGSTFYLDDEAGEGWHKVTHGGSPWFPHSNLSIEPDSIEPRDTEAKEPTR